MSIKLMTQVWGMKGMTGAEKLLLLCLADYANDDGICWPSMGTLADRMEMTVRSARRNIAKLEEMGHIKRIERERDNGSQASNYYQLTLSGGGDTSVRGGCQLSVLPPRTAASALEPSYEPPDKPIKPLTPQQVMFGALLSVTGWDEATLTVQQKARLGRVAGLLVRADYAKEDVEYFYKYRWPKDWRGAKGQRPSPENVRDGIKDAKAARIRAGIVTEDIADKNSLSWMYEGEDDE